MSKVDGVSVCIPCFNSSARLPETLRHLQRQRVPAGLLWEVIVIDNASTDNTAATAEKIWAGCTAAPLCVVREPRAGLSHARACAFRESRYEFVAFVDDDNWVCEEWVSLVYEILLAHPDVGACGGCGEPAFEDLAIPEWFSRLQHHYACGPQARSNGYVSISQPYLYGAGLSVRRTAWCGIISRGFQHILPGRTGTALSSGEDTEICLALVLAGWRLWYDSSLAFRHFIPPERLSKSYIIRLMKGNGAIEAWLGMYFNLLRPDRSEFQRIRMSPARVQQIREAWAFKVYASIRRAAIVLKALLRHGSRGHLDISLQWAVAIADLFSVMCSPLKYWKVRGKLKRAKWIEHD